MIIDRFAEMNAEIVGKHAYIGKFCTIGEKSVIGESAVILSSVTLPSYFTVMPTEIVFKTPTSLGFYRQCAQFILTDKYDQFFLSKFFKILI